MTYFSQVSLRDLSLSLHNLVCALNRDEFSTVECLINKFVGNKNAGAMVRRLMYWFPRAKRKDNRVYKSWRDWDTEVGLSRGQVKRVHKHGYLEAIGIERVLKKANGAPTNHYRLNMGAFLSALADFVGETVETVTQLMTKDNRRKPETQSQSTGQGRSFYSQQSSSDNQFAGLEWSDFATDDDEPVPDSPFAQKFGSQSAPNEMPVSENPPVQSKATEQGSPFQAMTLDQWNARQTTQSITNSYTQLSTNKKLSTKPDDLVSFSKKAGFRPSV